MSADSESVVTLRKNLLAAVEAATPPDPAKVVGLADRLLHHQKGDAVGLRCKAVALLRQKRYGAASLVAAELAQLQQGGPAADPRAAAAGRFLGAVCEYRQGNYAEAEARLLDGGARKLTGPAEWNLLAQALFNQSKFREAAEVYETELLGKRLYQDDVEHDELLTNLTACYCAMADVGKCAGLVTGEHKDSAENSHDILFNYATALAQKGRFQDAAATLAQAEKVCIFQNDLTPQTADFIAPILPSASDRAKLQRFISDAAAIKVQQAFVQFRLGNIESAEKVLTAVLVTHNQLLAGTAAFSAATLNWTAIKRHSSFLDSYNKLKQIQSAQISRRLTAQQKECAAYNQFLLSLGVDKVAQARSMAEAICRDYPNGTLGPRALAAVLASSDPKRAEQTLRKVLSASTAAASSSVHQTLTMAQLALERGDAAAALDTVASNAEAMSYPAVVCTVLAGYASSGAAARVDEILQSESVSKMIAAQPRIAFEVATKVQARLARHAEAAKQLERIAGTDNASIDEKKLWMAAAALEYVRARDVDAASKLASSAGGGAQANLAGKYNLAQCESAVLPTKDLGVAGFSGSQQQQQQSQQTKKIKEPRRRPGRRPPADTSKAIDPERWLPWNTRTYVKDMGVRKKQEAKRRRAQEQAEKRKAAEKAKKEAAAAAASGEQSK